MTMHAVWVRVNAAGPIAGRWLHPPLDKPGKFWLEEGQGSARAKVSTKCIMSTTTPTIRGEPVRQTLRILLTAFAEARKSHGTTVG